MSVMGREVLGDERKEEKNGGWKCLAGGEHMREYITSAAPDYLKLFQMKLYYIKSLYLDIFLFSSS